MTAQGPSSGTTTTKTDSGLTGKQEDEPASDVQRPAIDDPGYRERYWGSRYERPYQPGSP